MRIALLGGTGNLGMGLAVRFAQIGYEVIVGSRKFEKAQERAVKYNEVLKKLGGNSRVIGLQNEDAAKKADVSVFTIPWRHAFSTAERLKDLLTDKIVVSPLVPMERMGDFFIYAPPPEGSAAEKLAEILKKSRIVSAFHNIPAARFAKFDEKFELDVAVCGDDEEANKVVIGLINQIEGVRALDAGSLAVS
ncbi:NADPH-dependent F420 reductase, partial [Archaeoglobales archaeon]